MLADLDELELPHETTESNQKSTIKPDDNPLIDGASS
jgi:hypothetical protein